MERRKGYILNLYRRFSTSFPVHASSPHAYLFLGYTYEHTMTDSFLSGLTAGTMSGTANSSFSVPAAAEKTMLIDDFSSYSYYI
jgi:hypothetical protein